LGVSQQGEFKNNTHKNWGKSIIEELRGSYKKVRKGAFVLYISLKTPR
jgi:hypothetical protein